MSLEFRKATRRAVPLIISIAGPSGSGKTYSALLLAKGLAGAGRVGMVDTENRRGSMYVDSPGIRAALPDGFEILDLDPPFTPARYIECIQAAEKAGISVLVIDSGSHEWEGTGGCCEIAEKAKGMADWKTAKLQHKKYMNCLLSTTMHVIVCLRARDKVRVLKAGDPLIDGSDAKAEKTMVVPLGLQPICEKSFAFEMLVSLLLNEQSHCATPLKCPEPLAHLFTGRRLITRADGEAIGQWNDGAPKADPMDGVSKRARLAAEEGTEAYAREFGGFTKEQRRWLTDSGQHAENKTTAAEADQSITFITFTSWEDLRERVQDELSPTLGLRVQIGGVWLRRPDTSSTWTTEEMER